VVALGTDFAGVTDIDAAWSVTKTPRQALAEAVARRLVTPRGAYADFPDYGFDTSALIGSALRDSAIRQRVTEQVYLEEEIQSCQVDIVRTGTAMQINVALEDAEGPFDLTLNISDLGVEAIIPPEN
jgi:phage baseplate assembly protein W